MTNEAILQIARARIGLGSVKGPLHQPIPNRKPYWTWIVSNGAAATMLTQIYPWLIIKSQQAAIAVDMHRLNGQCTGGRGGMKPELAQDKARLFDLFQRAQKGETVDVPELKSNVSVHSHMFFTQTLGFRVDSLEALRDVVLAVLA